MNYQPNLDGVRALGALLVLLFHAKLPGFTMGFVGVDVFFVLSGFLITRLLIDEHERSGRVDYVAFTIRRLRRLYPALILFLAVYLAISPMAWPDIPMSKHIWDSIVAGVYMSDYATASGRPAAVIGHLWSLGVEEKFYLIWPFTVTIALRVRRNHAIALIAGMFVAVTIWRWYTVETHDHFWVVYRRFDTHSTGLLLGSLAAFANLKLSPKWGIAGLVGLAITMTLLSYRTPSMAKFGFTLVEMCSLMIVAGCPALLGAGTLPWLGKMSYGFYLWHYLLIKIGREHALTWPEQLLLGGLGGLACAAVSYYAVEIWLRAPNRQLRAHTP